MTTKNDNDWVTEVGKPAYESIAEMVAALDVDYDRMEELKDSLEERYEELPDAEGGREQTTFDHYLADLTAQGDEEAVEYSELQSDAGDCEDYDAAWQRIQEDPLSLRIFGERVDGEWTADRFELLLTTGGPAVRIMGELDGHEPTRAWLEVQDWGKSWTQYCDADGDVLLRYASQFFFE